MEPETVTEYVPARPRHDRPRIPEIGKLTVAYGMAHIKPPVGLTTYESVMTPVKLCRLVTVMFDTLTASEFTVTLVGFAATEKS